MVDKEFYMTRSDGVNLFRTYSTLGNLILQNETGDIYFDAVDIEGANFTYTETDTPGEVATIEDYQSALEELGVVISE